MSGENYYAPPAPDGTGEGGEYPESDPGFEENPAVTVAAAVRWTRIVSRLLYALSVVLALVGALFAFRISLISRADDPLGPSVLVAMATYSAVVFLGALLLDRAGRTFAACGALDDEEQLALGFRRLRRFFNVYVFFSLIPLATSLYLVYVTSCSDRCGP